MKLIVGLGNPGKEYESTRHNIGFIMIDKLADYYNIELQKNQFDGLYEKFFYKGENIIFLKPLSYMNLSGIVIKKFIDYYKISIDDILVIYDDMSLEVGNFKLKYKGSNAGHNGLRSIEENIGTTDYKRLKIGISKNKMIDTKKYVLSKFSVDEVTLLNNIKEELPKIIDDYLNVDFEKVMSKYNRKNTNV